VGIGSIWEVIKGEKRFWGRSGLIEVLEAEELAFSVKTGSEAAERAIVADNSVAGYDDWDWILCKGVANGTCGTGSLDLVGEPGVGAGFAPGYCTASCPDTKLEGAAGGKIERYGGKGGRGRAKVGVEQVEGDADEPG